MPTKRKVLILDYSKWRSGGNGENRTGTGYTCLLNGGGFMCCLGQFSLQFCKRIEPSHIRSIDYPDELNAYIPVLTRKKFVRSETSEKAIEINDDASTTPDEKIAQLRKLFAERGLKIRVINKP